VLRTLGTVFWSEGRLLVSRAGTVFDQNGALTDPKIKEQLAGFLRGFVAFVRSAGGA
jgi:chromate reductase, NAD(P)H dehydrogenase (quinone)